MSDLVLWGETFYFPDEQFFLTQGMGHRENGHDVDCYSMYTWEMRKKEFTITLDTNWTFIILN